MRICWRGRMQPCISAETEEWQNFSNWLKFRAITKYWERNPSSIFAECGEWAMRIYPIQKVGPSVFAECWELEFEYIGEFESISGGQVVAFWVRCLFTAYWKLRCEPKKLKWCVHYEAEVAKKALASIGRNQENAGSSKCYFFAARLCTSCSFSFYACGQRSLTNVCRICTSQTSAGIHHSVNTSKT